MDMLSQVTATDTATAGGVLSLLAIMVSKTIMDWKAMKRNGNAVVGTYNLDPLVKSIEKLDTSINYLTSVVTNQMGSHDKLLEDRQVDQKGIHDEINLLREKVARLEAKISPSAGIRFDK